MSNLLLRHRHEEVDGGLSAVLYDLPPGVYDVDARAAEGCREVNSFLKRYRVQAKEQKVSGMS